MSLLLLQRPQERGLASQPPKDPGVEHTYTPSAASYDEDLLDQYYTESVQTVTQPETQQSKPKMDTPMLPEKSSLRASRMFDLDIPFKPSAQSPELSQATPHDVYLSSEEDALSSADEFDFSDYDYDSESEDAQSPRRISHDNTARLVSVVFMGKPSIIDLPVPRRSVSPGSTELRTRASTISSVSSNIQRSATTPIEFAPWSIHQQSPRKSSLVSSLLSRKKPPFLNIDPYANGSTYSLDTGLKHEAEDSTAPKTPLTPTAILKNMSRTLSLVRKRSRPLLNTNIPMATTQEDLEEHDDSPAPAPASLAITETEPLSAIRQSSLPSPPVTYQDIMRAAKKNSMMTPPQQTSPFPGSHNEHEPLTPTTTAARRGILSGLAHKRRSVKLL